MDAFRETCERFMEKTRAEPDCMFYGWSFDGDEVHCREGYKDAQAILFHLQNVGPLLEEALKIATITRLEVHGPRSELEKLREPMADGDGLSALRPGNPHCSSGQSHPCHDPCPGPGRVDRFLFQGFQPG
jgi:quinol monooxygenase YgiN